MAASVRIMTVVGARPQFVKVAPVSRALAAIAGVEEELVHTGQHYDHNMSDAFFEELDIERPAHRLTVSGGGHGSMTGRMLQEIEPLIEARAPHVLLVYGDTNSTLAGALAAAKLHVPVAHVEAGLRSFNKRMPEEINRILTDHVSDLLLCSTQAGIDNLAAEGVTRGVHHVGDVMFDATMSVAERARARSDALERLGLAAGGYALATIHRAENTDDDARLARIMAYLPQAAQGRPVVLPLHPRTRGALQRAGITHEALAATGVRLVEPVGYLDMQRLLADAALVLTDSGGVQKEAYFHQVPCVTLRDETEWVETVEAGWNRLWTHDYATPRRVIEDYGEGNAAQACARHIVELARARGAARASTGAASA